LRQVRHDPLEQAAALRICDGMLANLISM